MRLQVLQCDADWDSMPRTRGGRHCDRCDRIVRDLTGLDDAEILRLLKREPTLCGRSYRPPTPRLRLSLALTVLAGCTPWGVHERLDVIEPGHWRPQVEIPSMPMQPELPEVEAAEGGVRGGIIGRDFSTVLGAMVAVGDGGPLAPELEASARDDEPLPFTLTGEVEPKPRRARRRGR